MQCANPPREWRKFRDLSSKARSRETAGGRGRSADGLALSAGISGIHSPSRPIARHREREQEVNFMVETG
jgi:hypothetical protein